MLDFHLPSLLLVPCTAQAAELPRRFSVAPLSVIGAAAGAHHSPALNPQSASSSSSSVANDVTAASGSLSSSSSSSSGGGGGGKAHTFDEQIAMFQSEFTETAPRHSAFDPPRALLDKATGKRPNGGES